MSSDKWISHSSLRVLVNCTIIFAVIIIGPSQLCGLKMLAIRDSRILFVEKIYQRIFLLVTMEVNAITKHVSWLFISSYWTYPSYINILYALTCLGCTFNPKTLDFQVKLEIIRALNVHLSRIPDDYCKFNILIDVYLVSIFAERYLQIIGLIIDVL